MSFGAFGIGDGGFGDYSPFVYTASLTDWEVPAGGVGSLGFTNTGLGLDTSTGDLLIGDFTNTRVVRASSAGAYVGEIILGGSPPANSVQGVAYDTSDGSVWVAHYALGGGSIRRYNTSGTLQQTISFAAVDGPNGIVYDATNDYIIAAADDGKARTYNAGSGALVSTVTLDPIMSTGSGATCDGIWIDLADTNWLFVSDDVGGTRDRLWRVNRQSGVVDRGWSVPNSTEGVVAYDGYLWMCADDGFHSSTPNGNRVHKLAITATSQTVASLLIPIAAYHYNHHLGSMAS